MPAKSMLCPMPKRVGLVGAVGFLACLLGQTSLGQAQGIEITPFGGYRFGGDFFEIVTGQPVDTDGAPAVGGIVDYRTADRREADAVNDMLATNLARVRGLQVLSSARLYEVMGQIEGTPESRGVMAARAAQQAGATELLEGTTLRFPRDLPIIGSGPGHAALVARRTVAFHACDSAGAPHAYGSARRRPGPADRARVRR